MLRNPGVKLPRAVVRPIRSTDARNLLFEFFNRADDGPEIRPVARFEFGMKELSIGANLKCAAARGDERERLDPFAEFENVGRQTDGLRRVVSNHAVFDRYLGFHFELLSEKKLSVCRKLVKRGSGVKQARQCGAENQRAEP
jgi:hypothetical protein